MLPARPFQVLAIVVLLVFGAMSGIVACAISSAVSSPTRRSLSVDVIAGVLGWILGIFLSGIVVVPTARTFFGFGWTVSVLLPLAYEFIRWRRALKRDRIHRFEQQ